jgi:hypothetical protein
MADSTSGRTMDVLVRSPPRHCVDMIVLIRAIKINFECIANLSSSYGTRNDFFEIFLIFS